MKKFVCGVLLTFSLSACKEWGTEGGNPQISPVDSQTPIQEVANALNSLGQTICSKRNICLGISDSSCLEETFEQAQMTLALGINPPYQRIRDLLEDRNPNLEVKEAELAACRGSISDHDCAPLVSAGVFVDGNYAQLHEVLAASESCSQTLQTK